MQVVWRAVPRHVNFSSCFENSHVAIFFLNAPLKIDKSNGFLKPKFWAPLIILGGLLALGLAASFYRTVRASGSLGWDMTSERAACLHAAPRLLLFRRRTRSWSTT